MTAGDKIVERMPRACSNEDAAADLLEYLRWGGHPRCPRCGDENVYRMKSRQGGRSRRHLWRCRGCAKQYTVRIDTIMEDSPIPLRHWCFAFWSICASKKGVSALQIQRQTGLSYKSAHFMMHRIREAMAAKSSRPSLSGVVEADETYVGGKSRKGSRKGRGRSRDKATVFAVVERDGDVAAQVVPDTKAGTLEQALKDAVVPGSTIYTDDFLGYSRVGLRQGWKHRSVNHSKDQFVGPGGIHTNTVESFFSLLERGLMGAFHCVSRKHLPRYVEEFSFRHNTRRLNDGNRIKALVKRSQGRRLKGEDMRC